MALGFKTGGRTTGTPNKVTQELRDQLLTALQPTLDALPATLASMEPVERAKLLTGLLPYVMPKLSGVNLSGEVELPIKHITGMEVI